MTVRTWFARGATIETSAARISITALATLAIVAGAFGQANAPSNSNGTSHQDSGKIIQFLSSTISWYRERASEQKLATEPSDLSFVQENSRLADQIVQQAFEYARSEDQFRKQQRVAQAAPQPKADNTQYERINESLRKIEQQIQDTQSELQATRTKLATTTPAKRPMLQAQVEELQSELGLMNARRDTLQTLADFVASSSGKQLGLHAQIEELARSVPPALSRPQNTNQPESASQTSPPSSSAPAAIISKSAPAGIWGLSTDLIRLSGKISSLNGELSSTEQLRKSADDLRAPLITELRNLVDQGDKLFAAADTSNVAGLAQEARELDALTAQFKQLTATVLPLSKVQVLLGIYETTLKDWRQSVREEEHDELKQLLLRLGVLVTVIALVFTLGEIWRRATFRYIHDSRRRYQFLLMRRIVIWTAVVIIVVLTFASQLGSAVTFAGLITAGIAVAMQSVITSIVGYFFLIGKYGLRVGDRVQIAGVTGEVVEIGLVRIHLMELSGPADPQPTGRIVAISNSVVFQAGPGIFKQIPGTNFIWHELKLTLASDTDYHQAKERIIQAVDSALGNYRDTIAAQRRLVESNFVTVSAGELQPKVRLHYAASGIEATIRFPVEMGKAAEIDDHLMRELMAALEREPKMKLISAEIPAAQPL